jgi:integrase
VGVAEPGQRGLATTGGAGRGATAIPGPGPAALGHVEECDPDFATYLWLAASTGARRSQLLGLRWAEIDVRHAAIGFARAYVEGPAGPVLRATKTHRLYRVAIDDTTIQRLIQHRRRAEARAAANAVVLAEHAFVFSADCDCFSPWLPNRVTKTFLGHLRHSGVGRFRLHDLRHFMATQMLADGVAVVTVSQRLGHARASTTLNVYGHCIPGADHDAARFIATLITALVNSIEGGASRLQSRASADGTSITSAPLRTCAFAASISPD